MTVREAEWTDEDRGWVLAWLTERDEACAGCGQPLDECRDRANAGRYQVQIAKCWACTVAEAEEDNRSEGGRRERGVYVGVRLNR